MPTKDEIAIVGMVVSEMMFRWSGFGPSRQLCDEFASKVMAEAKQGGFDVTRILKGSDAQV